MKSTLLSRSCHWATNFLAKSLPLMATAVIVSGGLSLFSTASATDLPTGVLTYLRQRDPGVQVRFDGLVRFSNGERYIPVIPQDPALNADAKQVISVTPEKSPIPDLIEFDNHFFLIRLIQTTSGRLTFAKLENYPIQLKEGLLPQDFVLPENLFIPVELKVLLGALPYNPAYTPPKPVTPPVTTATTKPASGKPAAKPNKTPIATTAPPAKTASSTGPANLSLENTQMTIDHRGRVGYVFDIPEQKLFAIDPSNGHKQSDVGLNCAPSALQVSPDGKMLFAPCLSSNELVVLDTEANLVKTRVQVGERPDALLYLPQLQQVWISNRFSPYLSVINATDLLPGERIELPGDAGALALFPTTSPPVPGKNGPPSKNPLEVAVADATQPNIYILNQETRQVARTLPALADISAMVILDHGDNRRELWAASRTEGKVMVLDATTGAVLSKFDVGRKPVALTTYANKLFVLCAGDAQVSVIDTVRKIALPPIALEENSFPSGLMPFPASARAYISAAGADQLVVLNLKEARVETTIPVDFRASLIAFTPDPQTVPAPQTTTGTSIGSPAFAETHPAPGAAPSSAPATSVTKPMSSSDAAAQPAKPTIAKPVAQPPASSTAKPEAQAVPVEPKPAKPKKELKTEETPSEKLEAPKAPKRFWLFGGLRTPKSAKTPKPLEMRPLPESSTPAIAAPATEENDTPVAIPPSPSDNAPRLPIPFLPNATEVLLPAAPTNAASTPSTPDTAKSRLLSSPTQQIYKAPAKKSAVPHITHPHPTSKASDHAQTADDKTTTPAEIIKSVPAWKKPVKPATTPTTQKKFEHATVTKPGKASQPSKKEVLKPTNKSKSATPASKKSKNANTNKAKTPVSKPSTAAKSNKTAAEAKVMPSSKAKPTIAKKPAPKTASTIQTKKPVADPKAKGAVKTPSQAATTNKSTESTSSKKPIPAVHPTSHTATRPVAKPLELPPEEGKSSSTPVPSSPAP